MKRPRLMMVTGNGPGITCGIVDYTVRLLGALDEGGFAAEWTWLCRRPRWFDPPFSSPEGLRLARPACAWNGLGAELSAAYARWAKPDLIHIHDEAYSFFETGAAYEIATAARCPIVLTAGEIHEERPSVGHSIRLLKKADIVLCNDAQTFQRCLKLGGRAPDHQAWVGPSISPSAAEPEAARIPGQCSTFGILNRGALLPTIYESFRSLRARGLDLRWQIIGRFDPAGSPYHAGLAERFNDPWITFAGYAEPSRLRSLLARSEMMVLPYVDGATMGRTTLATAWQFGLPVVANPAGIGDPAIEDGVNCLLAKEQTPQAWAGAIRRIHEDAALAARLAAAGRATAERFSWGRLAALHMGIYSKLLS